MVLSFLENHTGPEAAQQPQTITQSPPCLIVGMMLLLWEAALTFRHQSVSQSIKSSHLIDLLIKYKDVFDILSTMPLCWSLIFFIHCQLSLQLSVATHPN